MGMCVALTRSCLASGRYSTSGITGNRCELPASGEIEITDLPPLQLIRQNNYRRRDPSKKANKYKLEGCWHREIEKLNADHELALEQLNADQCDQDEFNEYVDALDIRFQEQKAIMDLDDAVLTVQQKGESCCAVRNSFQTVRA